MTLKIVKLDTFSKLCQNGQSKETDLIETFTSHFSQPGCELMNQKNKSGTPKSADVV